MRRLLLATVVCCCLSVNVGCFWPIYSGDPAARTQQLIFTSENFTSFSKSGTASGFSISRAI